MKVIIVSSKLKKQIEGIYNSIHEVKCTEDANGEWVLPVDILNNDNFISIRTQLEALPRIDFKPIIEEDAL
jgi:hypothetical protein